MLSHVHELARDCLKIIDEMVGIDSDTSPLGDETAEADQIVKDSARRVVNPSQLKAG